MDDNEPKPILPPDAARSEASSVRALAQMTTGQENPDQKDLARASKFLDSLKILNPETYKLRVTIDSLSERAAMQIGKGRLHTLMNELNFETRQVHPILDTSLKPETPIPHEAITGWAISRISERPTHKDINPEIWGDLFSIQTCLQKINILQTKPA